MSAEIKNLSPQHVWGYFYDLTQIPRPTGHMEAVTRFVNRPLPEWKVAKQ